jgi:diadenosine tetraphosphate (Ap4A) HIT family hydrolase
MNDFAVDPVILSLTHPVADWPLCTVFVYDDCRYPWGLLVPRRAGVIEICDLAPADQQQLMVEISRLSKVIRAQPGVEKINVGSLGNMVPQIHVHIVGRHKGDPAWPGPVWGHSDPVRYGPGAAEPLAALVRSS